MPARKRIKNLYELVMDFLKKCSDDHVGAFGAMSAFFILLSIFPFMIFLLTLTRYIPFSKDDIIVILTRMISFEEDVYKRQLFWCAFVYFDIYSCEGVRSELV